MVAKHETIHIHVRTGERPDTSGFAVELIVDKTGVFHFCDVIQLRVMLESVLGGYTAELRDYIAHLRLAELSRKISKIREDGRAALERFRKRTVIRRIQP